MKRTMFQRSCKKYLSVILAAALIFTCFLPTMSFAGEAENDINQEVTEPVAPEQTVEAAEFVGENIINEWELNESGNLTLEIALDGEYSFKEDIDVNDYKEQIIDGLIFQGLQFDKTAQKYNVVSYDEFVQNGLSKYGVSGYFPYLEEYQGAQITVYDRFVGLYEPGSSSQFNGPYAVEPSDEMKAKYPGVKKGIIDTLKAEAQLQINEEGNLVISCDSEYFENFTNSVPVCNGGIQIALCDIVLSAELPADIIEQGVSVSTKAGNYFTIREMKYHTEVWEYVDESRKDEAGVVSFDNKIDGSDKNVQTPTTYDKTYYVKRVENDHLTENDIRTGGTMGPNGTGNKLIRIVTDVRVGPAQWASAKNMSTFISNSFRTAIDAAGYGGNNDDIYTPKDDEQWAKVESEILNGGGDNPSSKYHLVQNKYVINYSGDSRMDVENPAPMWLMYEIPAVEDFSIDEDMDIYVNMIAGMTGGSGQSAAANGMPIIGMDGRVYFTIENSEYLTGVSLPESSDSSKEVAYGTSLSSLNLPKTLTGTLEDQTQISINNVEWNSEPAYDGTKPGDYVFTPVLQDEYVLGTEVVLPTISVTVKEAPSSGGSGGAAPQSSLMTKKVKQSPIRTALRRLS